MANEKFPVNLDEVWPLVYARRDKAVSSLRCSDLFVEGIDYQVFHQIGEKLKGLNNEGKNVGGRPQNTYMLSVPCLEFFIARKVRPVFEVYRQVFYKVADGGISQEEPLAPLSRFSAMIEDSFSIVRGNLSNAGVEDDGSLFDLIGKCRKFYHLYCDCINCLVYVETAFKLDGSEAFSPYDE